MKFTKLHGLGNDFVLIDGIDQAVTGDRPPLAMAMCDRHRGIGADGLIILENSVSDDFKMSIINADGSVPEMCGNGIRCLVKYVFDQGYVVGRNQCTIQTDAGSLTAILADQMGDHSVNITVDMGKPKLSPEQIPVSLQGGPIINHRIAVSGTDLDLTCVSMGNPHAVVFVDRLAKTPVEQWGPELSTHRLFPNQTNVEFVEQLDSENMKVRVWERGVGETQACGTGACAAAVAGSLLDRTGRDVKVELAGGVLAIQWAASDHVWMTGPAKTVFTGDWPISP